MGKKRSLETGQYESKASLGEVIPLFYNVEGPPILFSSEVAEELDVSTSTARRKLETLRGEGRVKKRSAAGRTIYYPADWDERLSDDSLQGRLHEFGIDVPNSSPPSELNLSSGSSPGHNRCILRRTDDLPDSVTDYETNEILSDALTGYYCDHKPRTDHGKVGVYFAALQLFNETKMASSHIRSRLRPLLRENYSNERSLWEALRPHVAEIPGVVYSPDEAQFVLDRYEMLSELANLNYLTESEVDEILKSNQR